MCVFLWFILSFFLIVCLSVTVKWLAVKTASEMTYTVSGGALNSTQSNPRDKFVKCMVWTVLCLLQFVFVLTSWPFSNNHWKMLICLGIWRAISYYHLCILVAVSAVLVPCCLAVIQLCCYFEGIVSTVFILINKLIITLHIVCLWYICTALHSRI